MKRRLTAKLLLASIATAPLAMAPTTIANAQSVSAPAQDIVISIGRGELVTVPGSMADVFIANDAVADVQVKSQRQLYVFGKAGGQTTIYASNARGDVIWSANIRVGNNIDSVDQMLALAMPEAQVAVSTMGSNTVLLTGTVAAPEDAAEAERLVSAFLGQDTNVISRLKMATPLQVNLQVRFAEVSRTLVREIGSNLSTRDSSGGFLFGVQRGNGPVIGGAGTAGLPILDASAQFGLPAGSISLPFDPSTGEFVTGGTTYDFTSSPAQTAVQAAGRLFGLDVGAAFDLSERLGLVTTLSAPNLTALSGETADFLAGGEFPIPISQGLGTTAIEYRNFGVSLSYTPTVLSNGRISIRVRPEVSELSTQGAVVINGFQIPSLTIRRAETTVELGSGQSFMIAGLMSNNAQNSIDKAPGLGDVPILGNLFRSRSFRRGETELVIVVTPYLVEPVNARDIKLPTDGFNAADEAQQFLGFRENDGVSGQERPSPEAVDKDAPDPTIGSIDPAAIVPGQNNDPRQAKKKSRKKDRRAEGAAPGFSL
ncbi:type II and III secretion system protein family protein [Altererythrobacter lutimaris]|uniref:Type II and III secretion system protein family protein n=1 Tax=Altererythrobacter lutimaris TaxID=2743979 RepID=A0A850HCS1_9SPHN|nr:type II and III secretion system protein family protein [Altererythrobacter lutimaris]NVE94746.1 type II and III secretion system protein family protein [Altererythrobacter lutimaris]